MTRINATDEMEAITNAWARYVTTNNLLNELRGLTKNYPFSSERLDEAKWMVLDDPERTTNRNYCWLILQMVEREKLIEKHARRLARKPTMWGGQTPTAANATILATACMEEWTRALTQLLRHWESPPIVSGN